MHKHIHSRLQTTQIGFWPGPKILVWNQKRYRICLEPLIFIFFSLFSLVGCMRWLCMWAAIVVRLFSGRVNINDIAIEWSFVSCSQVHIIFAYAKPKNRQSTCACSDFHLGDSLAWTQISIQNLHRFVCVLYVFYLTSTYKLPNRCYFTDFVR